MCFESFSISDETVSSVRRPAEGGIDRQAVSFFEMDGAGDAATAAVSARGFDAEAVVCAACFQSSGPFSKRQLKKAQAGEPARKFFTNIHL